MIIKGKSFVLCIQYWLLCRLICVVIATSRIVSIPTEVAIWPQGIQMLNGRTVWLLKRQLVSQHQLPDLVTWQLSLCPFLINPMKREDCLKSQRALLEKVSVEFAPGDSTHSSWFCQRLWRARNHGPWYLSDEIGNDFCGENGYRFRHLKIMI